MAGHRTPAAPLLSRRKPRLARTHMGTTHEADMLDAGAHCRHLPLRTPFDSFQVSVSVMETIILDCLIEEFKSLSVCLSPQFQGDEITPAGMGLPPAGVRFSSSR
ncbi:hypothetical protein NL108_012549 [Boleophthalmus pectinirostris]|nr:hypothetical protein NL108_012549 [Boleophthalmus pectinirostris]